MKPLIIFGCGGHGACVISTARLAGLQISHCVDDAPSRGDLLGVPVKATRAASFPKSGFDFVVAIGDCAARKRVFGWLKALGGSPMTIVHPMAYVAQEAAIGPGSVILAQAAIDPLVTIGENVIVNIGAVIGHDSLVEAHSHVSGNVGLSGATHVGEGVWVGINSCTIQGVSIGEWTVIGAGSVVVRDIPPRVVAFGNPAHRNIRLRVPAGD